MARLIWVQSQHTIKYVGSTLHSKSSLVRNSHNIKYKTQNPCNENPNLKCTDLRQTQRCIESWSISSALVPYSLRFSQVCWYYNNNIISKLYCTYRNHVDLLGKTKKRKNKVKQKKSNNKKQQQKKQKQQQHIIIPVHITGGNAIRQLLWLINR